MAPQGKPFVVEPRRPGLAPQVSPSWWNLVWLKWAAGMEQLAGRSTPQGSPSWWNLGGGSRHRRGALRGAIRVGWRGHHEVSPKGTNQTDPICPEPKMDFVTSHLTHHFHALDVGCWSMGSQYTPPTSLAPTETATWGRTDDPKPPDRHHSAGQVPDRPISDHLSGGQMVCPGPVRSSVRRTDDLSATCPGVCPHFFHFFPFMS